MVKFVNSFKSLLHMTKMLSWFFSLSASDVNNSKCPKKRFGITGRLMNKVTLFVVK